MNKNKIITDGCAFGFSRWRRGAAIEPRGWEKGQTFWYS